MKPKKLHCPLMALLLACLLLVQPVAAAAEDMRLYAAAGVKAPLEEIARDYQQASGQRVRLVFDTAGAAEQRFIADEGATFLVTTDVRLQAAEATGKLRSGVTIAIGATVGGLAARPGSKRPDISTPDALRDALLAAPRIAFSDPARGATVGRHFMQVIEALGQLRLAMHGDRVVVLGRDRARAALKPKGCEARKGEPENPGRARQGADTSMHAQT